MLKLDFWLWYHFPMNKDIFSHWPIKSPPRDTQIKALEWLSEQTTKFNILELPVGAGKSVLGLTYARFNLGSSFVLTPQRILQEQYERSFDKTILFSLYGKSNYTCQSKKTDCATGGLSKPRCQNCPHSIAKDKAKGSSNVVLNYKLALTLFANDYVFDNRETMILDECHNLEQELTEFDAISSSALTARHFNVEWTSPTTINQARTWCVDKLIPAVEKKLKHLAELAEPLMLEENLSPDDVETLKDHARVTEYYNSIQQIDDIPLDELKNEFVLVYDAKTVKFKRVSANTSFSKLLLPRARKFLFLSSTILNHKGFCKDIGIDINDTSFLSLGSEFEPSNRKVFYMPTMKMNAQWNNDDNDANRDKMLVQVMKLLQIHKEHKGIIHTGNFQIAEWLVEELEGIIRHKIFHHNPDSEKDRNDVINGFTSCTKPAILISPSITEGLDLIDDLGRFAIFAKVPFGFLGDQWIKKRLDMSQEWYQRQASIQVIQGGGRVVRSTTDWGNVYILDSSWGYLYNKTQQTIPQWWRDAYCVVD